MRLRAGAENLFKATTNRKLKDTVALELSFVNSNLQLLKEQLSTLNSSVELYQNDRCVSFLSEERPIYLGICRINHRNLNAIKNESVQTGFLRRLLLLRGELINSQMYLISLSKSNWKRSFS